MSNEHLFGAAGKACRPDTTNEAGGSAYALSAEHALARYAITGTLLRVFPRVIDDGGMLRDFVQIVRSGVTGRRSFGSAPTRALRTWFASRSPDVVFRQSIGQSPSMSDVIKMVRPPPRNDKGEADAVREALYGYLIGKNIDAAKLPALAQSFEAWKRGEGSLPDVPHASNSLKAASHFHICPTESGTSLPNAT